MTTIILDYFDKQTIERRTIHMIEDEGLFKCSLEGITILYDNRSPASKYPWGYQINERARHFFADFEVMKEVVNNWTIRLSLDFKLQHYGIIQGS